MSSIAGIDLGRELFLDKNSTKNGGKSGSAQDVSYSAVADRVSLSNGQSVELDGGKETFSLSGVFEQLQSVLTDMFRQFAEKVGLSDGGSPDQASMYAMEASFKASISIQYQESRSYSSSNGYEQVTHSRSVSVEVEVEMRVTEYRKAAENPEVTLADLSNYFTPENTSSRIADFAFGFFPMFRQDHPEMGDEEALKSFREMATKAIDKGMSEALQILGEIPGEISEMLNQTYDLTIKKLDELLGILNIEKSESDQ